MRRTVNLAFVLGLLLAVAAGGVASSTDTSRDLAPSPWDSPTQVPAGARQLVGTVERVEAVLGYLDRQRSVTFHYPGADYVKVHLRRLLLLPGDYLTVADPASAEVHRYEAGSLLGLGSALGAGGQWAMSVTGDTAVVTLHQQRPDPWGLTGRLGVTIDKVARGLLPAEVAERPAADPDGRAESICGRDEARDAACYQSSNPRIYRNTKAVARLLIDGIEFCTAFRVGAANRLLTNHHCLNSSRQAQRTEVWFNYQCAACDGWAVYRPTKVRGDRVLDTHQVLDYTLFTVDDFPAVQRFGYLELAERPVKAGEEIYIPQHPRGLPTRVALASDSDRGGACLVSDTRAHGYGPRTDLAYYCDTAGGSSGSPVLSRSSHRVIALHHFGGCPNGGVRVDLIRPRIAAALTSSL
jgi:hypothetical protein